MNSKSLKNSSMLFLAALIWGTTFVFQTVGNDYMQPFTFNSSRSLLGFLVLIPVILFNQHKRKKNNEEKLNWKITIIGGVCCGLAITAASLFQQYGTKFTTVGKAGFITTLYIIFTPILGIFLKKKCPWTVWIAAVASAVGLYMLCMTESFSLSLGDTLVFICAILFSIHILVIDYFSPKTDGVILSCIQFFVCFVISGILALIFDNPTWQQISSGAVPVLYAGIMSCGVAYTLQILGQKNLNPTVAAIILSCESVISTVAGYIAYKIGFLSTDQSLTIVQILGCVIVFAAVIFVQLPIPSKLSAKKK